MHWIRKTLTLALVAFWPLVSAHCLLEALPGFSFLDCGAAAPATPDCCKEDACQVVESGGYKIEDNQLHLSVQFASTDLREFIPVPETPPPAETLSVCSTAAPPEFPASRQFVFRTALPVRAPSLAS